MTNDFEKAFSDFLERQEYDQAEAALFDIIRTAFLFGWKAAGGSPPQPQRIFTLLPTKGKQADAPEKDEN